MDTDMDEVMLWLAKELTWHQHVKGALETLKNLLENEDMGYNHALSIFSTKYKIRDEDVLKELFQWVSKPFTLTLTETSRSDGSHRYTFDAPFATVYVRHPNGEVALSREEVESILPSEVKVEYKAPVYIYL